MARQDNFKLVACLIFWVAYWWHGHTCVGQEPAASTSAPDSAAMIVVLRDGGVLSGKVSRAGDRYLVSREGSEFQVAATNVLLVCRSLEEAYEQRRAKLGRADVDSHLVLAEWCLRYNLFSQASLELTAARELEPLHSRLALLERRLAAANKPRAQTRPSAQAAADNFEAAAPASAAANPLTTQLDELPKGAVERFTRRVQPILVNNCTLAGCHRRGGAQKFQLDRGLLHGLANRRSTIHNLTATLALIDREQPEQSKLLAAARETHGGLERPIFGPRQEAALTHVLDWIAMVGNSRPGGDEAPPKDDALQLVAYEEVQMPLASETDSTVQSGDATAEHDEAASLVPRASLRYGAQLQSWQPKDAFDPEIFNRAQGRRLPDVQSTELKGDLPSDSGE
jgi:hypothetical protein